MSSTTEATEPSSVSSPVSQTGLDTRAIVDDPAAIDTLRGQIDALDTALTRLIAERAQLSRRVQAARINAGGTRVELSRERAIHDRYREALGADGAVLADSVLRLCRGAS
ncbi:MAG TPA: chorismate mutase [Jatrophihabitans sp.]|jgi:chorismate mutase